MSYPQPLSTTPILQGQTFWRLFTPLAGPGDIYESVVSGLGFAMGPNSDLSEVLVTYLDADQPTGVNSSIISPTRNFVGRVDARNDTTYPSSKRLGRILFSPNEIFDPLYTPQGFTGGDVKQLITPIIDVIQYFTSAPSVVPQRSDREFQFQYFEAPAPAASTFLLIPAYGRKSGFFSFVNQDNTNNVTVTINGVQLSPSGSPGVIGAYEQSLFTAVILNSAGSANFVFNSSNNTADKGGIWDYFCIEFGNYAGNAMPTSITLSDAE